MNPLTFGNVSFKNVAAVMAHSKSILQKYPVTNQLNKTDSDFMADLLSIAPSYREYLEKTAFMRIGVDKGPNDEIYTKLELVTKEGWSRQVPLSYWHGRLQAYNEKYKSWREINDE
jgi:hypothetical protein